MIDIHTHILPGVDDGSQSIDDSIVMAEIAVECGVTDLVATPHVGAECRTERLTEAFQSLREELKQRDIPLRLHYGMEILGSGDIRERILDGELAGLNGSAYYLVEFYFDESPEYIGNCLDGMLEAGVVPVIAHPERYGCVQRWPQLLYEWVGMGCVTQANKGSFLGRFGRHAARTAEVMLEYGLITCIASDGHNPYRRTNYLGDIRNWLSERAGEEAAELLLCKWPRSILRNEKIERHGRFPERHRSFWR